MNTVKRKILVVDDEPGIALLCDRILSRAGFDVISTWDPRKAVEILKTDRFDMLLTDIRMPEIDGFDLISRAQILDPAIAVLVITGFGTVETAIRALRQKVDGLLLKQFRGPEELLQAVNQAFYDKRAWKIQAQRILGNTFGKEDQALQNNLTAIMKDMDIAVPDHSDKNKNYISSTLHSLKSEIMNIKFAADSLLELLEKNEDAKHEYEILARSCDYSYILLQRAMDSLSLGKPKLEIIKLKEVLDRLDELIRPRLPEKIRLKFIFESSYENLLIEGNFIQVLGIFYEFIENSITELRKNGGDIEIHIREAGPIVVITISDSGQGMPDEIRDKVFKEQVPSKSGSGLGLLLNYKAIEDMGGRLQLESVHGKGTHITIVLPTILGTEDDKAANSR